MSMERCIMLYTQEIFEILKHLFSPFLRHKKVRQILLYTHRDKKTKQKQEKKKKKKLPRTILLELQYKYRFMHTMKASFPIFNILVNVTILLQCSVVYTGLFFFFFFSTHESPTGNNKKTKTNM